MRISVIVTYLTHDPMIKVQVLCPHTGTLGGGGGFVLNQRDGGRKLFFF